MIGTLPVADPRTVARAARRLLAADRRTVTVMVVLNVLAALAGLGGPWLFGRIVDAVTGGSGTATVDRLALAVLACAVVQTLLSRSALRLGHRFGERTAARIREGFLERSLNLPAAVVERVPTGDLVARGTTDVDAVATTLRNVLPEMFVAIVRMVLITVAVVVLSPPLGAAGLLGFTGIWFVTRWYLCRAREAYLREGEANSAMADELAATTAGARTIEAFGLRARRLAAGHAAIAETNRTRLATLRLRSVFFPLVEFSYVAPIVVVLLAGGALYFAGSVTLGTVAAALLYLRQMVGPLDTIMLWIEQLQSSSASFARAEGLATVPPDRTTPVRAADHAPPGRAAARTAPGRVSDRTASGRVADHAPPRQAADRTTPGRTADHVTPGRAADHALPGRVADRAAPGRVAEGGTTGWVPDGDLIEVRGVRFVYEPGRDVLLDVDLTVRPGERLAVVGLSGAGKSTLGRLIAGLDRPHTGSVTVGGVPPADLPPDELRRHVVLVTQEHHIFRESLRDNLIVAAPDDVLRRALRTVGADWADDLDADLGENPPDGARAQQLALARVVLADPHTVILDEATALLDPTAARDAERALAAVLHDRTVIAIAHRLQTAHDADRVAVMEGGRIIELGSHDELLRACGPYASLWASWHGT
ncbi:ABC transporter ATP-binding protein [Pseudosporangium ferrugineum]|uniref:ABC transporter family protein n=1 Tax=Pseudosporangium ferrugineum TaxID=439699 RepID=A0A2T0RHY5_9ACTN|nr:ABC transporter ATP-binding protein [Pseudosporangium ferrugineum]PRY20768.1 ABC transporter family protein [Pseudosporangium ferrugineum]